MYLFAKIDISAGKYVVTRIEYVYKTEVLFKLILISIQLQSH